MVFDLFLFSPLWHAKRGRRGPYGTSPQQHKPPSPTLFSPFYQDTTRTSPQKRNRWLLHDLICRLLPLLPGIHPHYDWLDLQECTRLPPIVRSQLPWELSRLQPQLEGWYSTIGGVIASPNENVFQLIKIWKKLNQYRVHNRKKSVGFVNQVKIQEAELSTGRAALGGCTVRKP